ncbi:MAG TPA: hypothetical protein VLD57_09815 [Blastocatellia bacterium]|nr:hypothetical protein [Blastocatellia bacterium]
MTGQEPQKLRVEGVSELWLRALEAEPDRQTWRPALLIECSINFRSLRAGLNHSEERNCTAWLPEGSLAIDWDRPAIDLDGVSQLASQPGPDILYHSGNYLTTKSDIDQYEAELIDKLVRVERLRVFFNPVFGLFSAPEDPLDEFLARVAEAALSRVEPEMKHLRGRFELQLEQVREAHFAKGSHTEEINLESFISHKLHIFESENRLAGMFSTLAGAVFGSTEPRPDTTPYEADEAELREDLDRIEQEASDALRALYEEYLKLANEYDIFEIGLQPDNVQIIRRVILWIPLMVHREA